ncbi:DUF503 family protein [Actinomycetospora sp. CA-101289]|uniref:DUF503 family protein n=1 Tax=Actinomycetospora sp. CA-101289 TaxID=3239893 RepID=UPI003D979826
MYVGALELDLLLGGEVGSIKQKRSVVRPVVAELKRYGVAVAEAGHLDLHRRALLGVAAVAADAAHVGEVLDQCERVVAAHPEFQVLSARTRWLGPHDD